MLFVITIGVDFMPKRKLCDVDQSVGKGLKKYRIMSGLTQEQVALQININRTTYTKYESGVSEPSLEILKKISNLFGVPLINIIGDEDIAFTSVADSAGFPSELEKEMLSYFRILCEDDKRDLLRIAKEMLANDTFEKL